MKRILLVCNDGMSTGYLTNKMIEEAGKRGLDVSIRAISEMTLDREWENSDCILLGPQVGYLKGSVEKRIHNMRPVEVINPMDYGRINASGVLDQGLKLIGEK